MKIKHRFLSALLAAATTLSLVSTVSFAQDLKLDFNGDGYENSFDALFVLKESMKTKKDIAFDANGDGYVNSMDALYVLKVVLGKIKPEAPETPAPEVTDCESILDDYENKWAYSLLTDKQKQAYLTLVDGILKCKSSIDISDCNIIDSDYDKAFAAILADNPHAISTRGAGRTTLSGGKMLSIRYTYNLTAAECSEIMKKVEQITADVIAEAKNLPNDYERVKLFHDWIINRTTYIDNGESYLWRLDGPIIQAKSVCEGYSKAFSYLCQSVGIECLLVSGTAVSSISSGPHMWNMVKIDGSWYHTDVTWDDPVRTDGKPVLRYDYLLISQAKISKDHSVESTFKIPAALSDYTA